MGFATANAVYMHLAGGAFSAAGRIAASLGATLLFEALPARTDRQMQTLELVCTLHVWRLQAVLSQQLAALLLAWVPHY
jgi:hypothetical protein